MPNHSGVGTALSREEILEQQRVDALHAQEAEETRQHDARVAEAQRLQHHRDVDWAVYKSLVATWSALNSRNRSHEIGWKAIDDSLSGVKAELDAFAAGDPSARLSNIAAALSDILASQRRRRLPGAADDFNESGGR